MNALNSIYKNRVNLAVEYINNNLSDTISLNDLAKVACFSPFHFHRIFMAVLNETVNDFTNRVRLEKASRFLKYSKKSIRDIALECGFSSPSTFSRAYKHYFEITPTYYRKFGFNENSKICKDSYHIKKYLAPVNLDQLNIEFPVNVIDVPQRRVAFIRVYDSFKENSVLNKFGQLIKWSRKMKIFDTENIFGMSLDDVMVTPKNKFRYEVCITIPEDLVVDDPEISTMTIPKCKYASTRVLGNIEIVSKAWHYLFNGWLINSAYEPEHLHAIEQFLDKSKICDWSNFDLELCVPVKPLQKYLNN